MTLDQLSKMQRKEQQKQVFFERFRKRLIVFSLFMVVFSVFVLLNACIGYSSAPFYTPETTCSAYDPDFSCLMLKNSAEALYMVETIFALLLCAHGCLAVSLCDNLENIFLRKTVSTYC